MNITFSDLNNYVEQSDNANETATLQGFVAWLEAEDKQRPPSKQRLDHLDNYAGQYHKIAVSSHGLINIRHVKGCLPETCQILERVKSEKLKPGLYESSGDSEKPQLIRKGEK